MASSALDRLSKSEILPFHLRLNKRPICLSISPGKPPLPIHNNYRMHRPHPSQTYLRPSSPVSKPRPKRNSNNPHHTPKRVRTVRRRLQLQLPSSNSYPAILERQYKEASLLLHPHPHLRPHPYPRKARLPKPINLSKCNLNRQLAPQHLTHPKLPMFLHHNSKYRRKMYP